MERHARSVYGLCPGGCWKILESVEIKAKFDKKWIKDRIYDGISINYFVCFRVTLHYVEYVMKASYVAELGIVCKTNGFFMISGGIEVK